MRCLYCGRQLALFRKLTGGGEFCSDAHRQSYQDEYNRLALSRLLQTQNAGEEPPSGNLPVPKQKLQRRAGSLLDLHDVPALTPHRSSADQTISSAGDATRRAGFVPDRLKGQAGAVTFHSDTGPNLPAAAEPSFPSSGATAGPAIRKRAERVPIPAPSANTPAALLYRIGAEIPPRASEATLPCSDEVVDFTVPPTAGKVRLPSCPAQIAGVKPRRPVLNRISADGPSAFPRVEAPPAEPRHIGAAHALPLPLPAEMPEPELLQFQEQAAYTPCFEFADTVATGYVAGMKLGIEQIRFEFIGSTAEPEPEAAEPPAAETAADDEMLPHEFIAAVQAIDATAKGWEAQPDAALEVQAVRDERFAAAEPIAAESSHRMCAWLPIDLTAVPANTRQKLMQTFQAVGVAAAVPAAPEYGMLPVRPKYVVGRAPSAAAAGENGGTTSLEAVAEAAPMPVPAEPYRRPPVLETIPVEGALEFLQDYEKRGQSIFSKLLGKIGRG
jgi:hypothetical protein